MFTCVVNYVPGNGFSWRALLHSSFVVGQAQLAHCMAWLDPIDDREMVQQLVANWAEAKVWANMWDQYCMKGSFHGRGADCGQD